MAKDRKATKRRARPAGSPPTKPSAPTTGSPDAEQRILEAARRVFIRRGTAGARMQEIAQEAGVNQALLHYYFRSKEQLSTAVFEQFAMRLFPALLQTISLDIPLAEKVERIVSVYHAGLTENPFLPGYVIGELHYYPDRIPALLTRFLGTSPHAALQPHFERLGAQIDAEVRAGRMRPISPLQFVIHLMSLCIFPFAWRPMLKEMFAIDDAGFLAIAEERKRIIPAFVLNALRP